MKDDLGDRMKAYEQVTDSKLISLMPVVLRLDGRAFHTLTKPINKPFDKMFIKAMDMTLFDLCAEVPNCQFGYVQSDEISLVLLESTIHTEPWFSNRILKICSLSSSLASTLFRSNLMKALELNPEVDRTVYLPLLEKALFDCRVFNVPVRDVANYLIWRQKDCQRNVVLTLGQHYIGKKAINCMSVAELKVQLNSQFGIDADSSEYYNGRVAFKEPVFGEKSYRMKWTVEPSPVFVNSRFMIENNLIIDES